MDLLIEILKDAGRDIAKEFRLASSQGKGTPDEVSEFRENSLQKCLQDYYPQSYVVQKNKITALDGTQSNSIDCVIVNPAHPRLYDPSGRKFRIVFADGCDAAIDVKPDLARTDELERVLKQGISVKKVKRSKSAASFRGTTGHLYEHTLFIPFYAFALKAFDAQKLFRDITAYYREHCVPLEEQIDGICVNGVGLMKHVKHKELNPYGPSSIGNSSGWYQECWGDVALLGFLLALELSAPSTMRITESILGRALKGINCDFVIRLGDIVQPGTRSTELI